MMVVTTARTRTRDLEKYGETGFSMSDIRGAGSGGEDWWVERNSASKGVAGGCEVESDKDDSEMSPMRLFTNVAPSSVIGWSGNNRARHEAVSIPIIL